ncbi:MAG: site-specific DNA-methyltransferase [Microscillaceae bacterium]|nr:site-specific DNA-methyltransferase [Microscillaceae bacterium]MDW8460383.1 hypothetical protein [Cytophagales bacterium]
MTIPTPKKIPNPHKLPFLQAQILQKIYCDVFEQKHTTLNELADLTDYPPDSKILAEALNALTEKGFLNGNLETGFEIPETCQKLFEKVTAKSDYKNKKYNKFLLQFANYKSVIDSLFEPTPTISELNQAGTVHQWYDYLEDFPFALIEYKLKEYHIQPNSLVVEPFAGSGTTCISANFFNCHMP